MTGAAFVIDLLASLSITGVTADKVSSTNASCFSSIYTIEAPEPLFLKLGDHSTEAAFRGEFDGLRAIEQTKTVMCPRPIAVGAFRGKSYLLMSQLKHLSGSTRGLGKQLALMHTSTTADRFGFPGDTYCGSTRLDNTQTDQAWPEWFAERRIGDILKQIDKAGMLSSVLPRGITVADAVEKVRQALQTLAPHATPRLLHGDLWGGNAGSCSGTPCIYDPACYYGDNEVDLALTQLFGDFDPSFLSDYGSVLPISAQFKQKTKIYNLYHILNHALMFGGGYCSEAMSILARI